MRIGLFTDTFPPHINGVATSVLMLKTALEKKGHEVFIVTVNDDALEYKFEDDDKIIRIPGIPIGIYDYRLTGIYPVKAINIIRKWDLDVIHSHTEFGVGTFARIIAKQFDIPLVHTYHTMYEDYIHYITKGYFDKSSKKIVEYLTLFYCDKTVNELIVPTKKTYDLFKEKYEVNKNIHIVPTGIEIDRFYKENVNKDKVKELKRIYNISKDDLTIIFVGRLAKEKNIEFLIRNHEELVKYKKNIKLLIIGDGPDMEEYGELIKTLKLQDNVILGGKVPYVDIPCYYQLADIFVTASTTETQGLTVIEAMAGGITPVCIKDESFITVVIDGLNGRIFTNKEEYLEIMKNLIDNPKELQLLSKQARLNAEGYSSKYYAERVLDVYIKSQEKKKGFFQTMIDNFKKKDDEDE
ncbi:MAG: glycosyltransferase [Bacilli bacterium]|nr:glycosyltransferase [Bacilli bacterium]